MNTIMYRNTDSNLYERSKELVEGLSYVLSPSASSMLLVRSAMGATLQTRYRRIFDPVSIDVRSSLDR
jgi:hypothetical protein